MPEPPRVKRFQIHLSTALVMMFVAGGLIWANVNGRRVVAMGHVWYPIGMPMHGDAMSDAEFIARQADNYWHGNRGFEFGWPFRAAERLSEEVIKRSGETFISKPAPGNWYTAAVIENGLVAVGILLAVWFFCEGVIRRRADGKTAI